MQSISLEEHIQTEVMQLESKTEQCDRGLLKKKEVRWTIRIKWFSDNNWDSTVVSMRPEKTIHMTSKIYRRLNCQDIRTRG